MDPTNAKCKNKQEDHSCINLKFQLMSFFFFFFTKQIACKCLQHSTTPNWFHYGANSFEGYSSAWDLKNLWTNDCIAEVCNQQGPEIQQSMADMAGDEITDWLASSGKPFQAPWTYGLNHTVQSCKSKKKGLQFLNAVIIKTMKTHHKICLPRAKFADTVIMSLLTKKTQFKQHSWSVNITTTKGSWH